MTVAIEPATGRSLVSDQLFERLVSTIIRGHRLSPAVATRIVDQALVFLAACAKNPAARLGPSRLVDIGWHTFVLHTRDYRQFCDRVAGRFIDHVPTEEEDETADGPEAAATLRRTVRAIREAGFTVDTLLWPSAADSGSSCSQCHNGCTDS